MTTTKCTTLAQLLEQFPDPRRRQGKRHLWGDLLIGIVAAIASSQQGGSAIVDWIHEHAPWFRTHQIWQGTSLPSGSTIRRTLHALDVAQVEQRLREWEQELVSQWQDSRRPLEGLALDGKTVRGALAHGNKVHLVSLVPHRLPLVLAQIQVPDKTNEITAARTLLTNQDLTNWVVTMDALHTQHATLQQINDQQGHYLVQVKANQPELYQILENRFLASPQGEEHEQVWQTQDRGHAREETRTLTSRVVTSNLLGWPKVAQMLHRVCQVTHQATGKTTTSVSFAITDLSREQANTEQLEALWRGHWAIENKLHYVRDVTFGEDAGQIHTGNAPHSLAILRNALLSLLRLLGWTNIAQALRYFAAFPCRVLQLLTTPPLILDRQL
jgi:predicted transposase YbfD/YdcC